jgi:hypothetical protein
LGKAVAVVVGSRMAVLVAASSPDFFFLLRPSELVPVWIRGDGVDLGDTTIVCVAAVGLKINWNVETRLHL